MKTFLIIIVSFVFLQGSTTPLAFAQCARIENLLPSGRLSDGDIISGLKEALQIGTGNAVTNVSKTNGYYRNPKIKIPLPQEVQDVEKLLRATGLGSQVDKFVLSMNRAAEQAAPKAKSIFWNAIKQITFADARKILAGRNNEATLYFKGKTYGNLDKTFRPITKKTMDKVGVTRVYQNLYTKVQSIPFTEKFQLDLNQYVTEKALDGLFLLLSEEERKIREDPVARVTELLKKVFGNK